MVLASGAVLSYPNQSRLVIDAGTCITYDYIDNKYVMPEKNFDFFSLLISLIYDNNNVHFVFIKLKPNLII